MRWNLKGIKSRAKLVIIVIIVIIGALVVTWYVLFASIDNEANEIPPHFPIRGNVVLIGYDLRETTLTSHSGDPIPNTEDSLVGNGKSLGEFGALYIKSEMNPNIPISKVVIIGGDYEFSNTYEFSTEQLPAPGSFSMLVSDGLDSKAELATHQYLSPGEFATIVFVFGQEDEISSDQKFFVHVWIETVGAPFIFTVISGEANFTH